MCGSEGSCCCCICTSTATLSVIESCGRFSHVADPGCSCLVPCVHTVRGVVSLKLLMANVTVDTKTKDNAVVRVEVRIHYHVIPEKAADALYKFSNPEEQIGSFTSSIVRGEVPKYTLDELFMLSDQIKKVVEEELAEKLNHYGYSLESTLITRIDPSKDIKLAISQTQVNAYKRTAAEHQAELNKILKMKRAEAEFEEKRLAGVGLAQERRAIVSGLRSSIEDFVNHVPGMKSRDVMNLLLMNQYFDALKAMGATGDNRLVILPGELPGEGKGGNTIKDFMAAEAGSKMMR